MGEPHNPGLLSKAPPQQRYPDRHPSYAICGEEWYMCSCSHATSPESRVPVWERPCGLPIVPAVTNANRTNTGLTQPQTREHMRVIRPHVQRSFGSTKRITCVSIP